MPVRYCLCAIVTGLLLTLTSPSFIKYQSERNLLTYSANASQLYDMAPLLQVYQSPTLTVPPGGFYAAVGLHSQGETIRLCEVEPWRGDDPLPCLEPGVVSDMAC